jgi:hypothetical protein
MDTDIETLHQQYRAVAERLNRYPMTPAGWAAILAEVEAGYRYRLAELQRQGRAAPDLAQIDLDPAVFQSK